MAESSDKSIETPNEGTSLSAMVESKTPKNACEITLEKADRVGPPSDKTGYMALFYDAINARREGIVDDRFEKLLELRKAKREACSIGSNL